MGGELATLKLFLMWRDLVFIMMEASEIIKDTPANLPQAKILLTQGLLVRG